MLPKPVTIAGTISRLFTIPTAATVTMHSLNIINGRASGDGGAINNFGNCTLISCTLSGNWADGSGGGIFNQNSATCTVLSSTFNNNTASYGGMGGAIGNAGNCVVRTSTFSGNRAGTGSGGAVGNSGTCTLSSATLSANSSGNSAGGIFNSGTLNLTSSIVAGNTAPTGANIVGSTPGNNNVIDGDPNLAPLGDYGGPVQTMHPLIQRGFPIVAVADIGAVEYQENADLRRFWPLDWDNDGSPFGIEFALGTNPSLSDSTNPANLSMSAGANGHPVLTFGRNPAANSITIWRLTRSTTLLPESFTEIFSHLGPTGETTTNGSSANVTEDSFEVTDNDPPSDRAFYRVEAISP